MGGRTFRSRWVVRWLLGFGTACLVAALALLAAAARTESTAAPTSAERTADEELCRLRLETGQDPTIDAGVCDDLAKASFDPRSQLTVGSLVLAALGLSQVLAAFRVGITTSGPGVTIRNPLRTHRLLWSEIERFRVERGLAGRATYAFGRVDLVDGRSHRIEAVCAMPWEPKRGFADEHIIAELNAELARHRRIPTGGMDLDRQEHAEGSPRAPEPVAPALPTRPPTHFG